MDNVKLKASEKNIQIKTEVIASTNTAGGIVDYAEDKDVDLNLWQQHSASIFYLLNNTHITHKVKPI